MATITEDYVSYEVAKLLKEKGFDIPVWTRYEDDNEVIFGSKYDWNNSPMGQISAPTLQMAIKWLREVHNIDIIIDAAVGMLGIKVYVPFISTYKPRKDDSSKVCQNKRGLYYKDDKGVIPALQYFDSYEETVEAAIKYCLEKLI